MNRLAHIYKKSKFVAGVSGSLAMLTALAGIELTVRNLIHPHNDREIDRSLFDRYNISHQDVEIYNEVDGLTIRGSFCVPEGEAEKPNEQKRVVILGHGMGGHRLSNESKAALTKKLLDRGIAVLLIDYRNCGESDNGITGIGVKEKNDTHAASLWLEKEGYNNQALFGGSQAGATSLVTAAENPLIKAVVAETAFYSLEQYLRENAHKWIEEKIPPAILKGLMKDGKLHPRIMDTLITAVRMHGVDLREMEPYQAMPILRDEGVQVDLWTHVNDRLIPPEENTKALADIYGHYHPITKEPVMEKGNSRRAKKLRNYHLIGYDVLGDEFIQQITNQLERGLNRDLNRENIWREQGKGNWRDRFQKPRQGQKQQGRWKKLQSKLILPGREKATNILVPSRTRTMDERQS